jgi:hypothetical protein
MPFNTRCRGLLLLVALLAPASGLAQPSNGPYGPIARSYAVPTSGRVYFVAPDGSAGAAGTRIEAPTTLESAIARVRTRDTIVLRGGIYRVGGLQLNQGVTLQPYLDERPVLKGTRVAAAWETLPSGIWRTRWTTLFPARPLGWWRREREAALTPLHRFNNDMVFVDGQPLRSVGWPGELDAQAYYIDYEQGYVYVGVDPAGREVEITAHDVALHRPSRRVHGKASDRKGPTILGITFTQYAYRAIDIEGEKPATTAEQEPTDDPVGVSPESAHGKAVVGTRLENVTISHCSRVAGYFRGDGLVIRHSEISDTGTEGIYVIGSSDVLLERNVIRRNNVEQLTGYYPAAVKIFNQSYRVTVRDNLVIDHPHSNGVWFDVGNVDGRFIGNHVEGTQAGFFFEISKGVLVAGNVFVDNQEGVRVLNASGARVMHNTFVNSPVLIDRNERSAQGDHFGWHPRTGPDVDEREGHVFVGNLLVAEPGFGRSLLRVEQAAVLCGTLTRPMVQQVDGNLYLRAGPAREPLFTWAPVPGANCQSGFATLVEWQQAVPGIEGGGHARLDDPGPWLRSVALRRLDLVRLPAGAQPRPVDEAVRAALGWDATPRYPGALPVAADVELR